MQLGSKLKHYFFSAFRELFVHNHGSLEFRAKVFALIIAVDEDLKPQSYEIVKSIGLNIYNNDEDRANLLMLSTKELVKKVKENNGLDIDTLVLNIQRDLRMTPRYAKKIDTQSLEPLLILSHDNDTLSYQRNVVEFLDTLKADTLKNKKNQIDKDEKEIVSKYEKV